MVPRPRLLERLNAGLDRKLTLMRHKHKKVRAAVRREHAENYILTSVVAFAVTVIATRGYLELTGHP
jgi:hypothetical protein